MPVRLSIPETLLAELGAWRARRSAAGGDDIEKRYDAYCLDPGLGPAWYLTSEGRVLRDGRGWDDEPLREATDAEAFQTIVVGAKKTRITALLDLLPGRPMGARACVRCAGTRYASVAPAHPDAPSLVCPGLQRPGLDSLKAHRARSWSADPFAPRFREASPTA